MKFEKFFKSAGTHGLIVKKSENETWLVCGVVGMKIPEGVNNLGVNKDPDPVFKAIVNSYSEDDYLVLKDAILKDPEGKANDIIRVFETDLGDRIGIYNTSYGLLEKKGSSQLSRDRKRRYRRGRSGDLKIYGYS